MGLHPKQEVDMAGKSLAKMFGVREDYTEEELKARFRELAKKYHTDNAETGNGQKFIKTKEIYDVLKKRFEGRQGSVIGSSIEINTDNIFSVRSCKKF